MTRIGSLSLAAVAISFAGCSLSGPTSVATGRSAYNLIINKTEDEQILNLVVRERYDETYGLLAVSSVTSSIKTTVRAASELGFGPTSNYDGNLVPLTIGAAYEENPTISYVPLAGEAFLLDGEHRLLSLGPGAFLDPDLVAAPVRVGRPVDDDAPQAIAAPSHRWH